jgi:hypothetical protein
MTKFSKVPYNQTYNKTMGYSPPPPPGKMKGSTKKVEEGGTCKECGCSLSHAVGSFEKHQEWHELITTAIREQVEELVAEAVKQERSRTIEATAKLMGYQNVVNDGHVHRWVDKGLLGESKLIVCVYCGLNHDNYKPRATTDLSQSCDHSWKELDDGEYICIKCKKTDVK